MQVFDIEDLAVGQSTKKSGKPNSKSSDKVPTAVVARPRDCTMCRECIRREGWEEKVQLKRISDHFLFSVESTGCIPPERIVREVR